MLQSCVFTVFITICTTFYIINISYFFFTIDQPYFVWPLIQPILYRLGEQGGYAFDPKHFWTQITNGCNLNLIPICPSLLLVSWLELPNISLPPYKKSWFNHFPVMFLFSANFLFDGFSLLQRFIIILFHCLTF